MTPWEAFKNELQISGHKLCRCPKGYHYDETLVLLKITPLHAPEDNAAWDQRDNTVHISMTKGMVDAGISGLHELGHAATTIRGKKSCFDRYRDEVVAWDWAEARMPTGWEEVFKTTRTKCLLTYEKNMCPICTSLKKAA